MIILDGGQVDRVLEFLRFRCAFPPAGNRKARRVFDQDTVRRASRMLLSGPDDPLLRRAAGRWSDR